MLWILTLFLSDIKKRINRNKLKIPTYLYVRKYNNNQRKTTSNGSRFSNCLYVVYQFIVI